MSGKKRAAISAHHEATVIYPHQLLLKSPAVSPDRPVVLAEDPWFFGRFRFCAQKLVLHRATMRRYRDHLAEGGFRVEYIEAADLDTSTDLFVQLGKEGVSGIHLCDPLEFGLIEEIEKACSMQRMRLVTYESPMFLCSRDFLAAFYKGGKRFYLTEFYIAQRKRYNILLEENGKPVGKRWTYDTLNREPLPKDFPIPPVWHTEPNEYVHGICYTTEHIIQIAKTVNGKKMSDDSMYQTFLHEFVHAALHILGREDDEELAAGLEQMYYQLYKTAKYPKTSAPDRDKA